MTVSKTKFGAGETIDITIDVTNTGNRFGKEAVLLYSSDLYASISPDVKRLRRFSKIALQPDETQTVNFSISAKDLAFVNTANQWITEPGEFVLTIGNQKASIFYQ
jgi:beta-glucosidase